MNINEEIIYCTNCGAVNKASAVVCKECEKNIRKKHYAFFDFLSSNTKDKFKGDAEDFVLKRIENFLISHIYGAVLTITIVTGAVAFAVPNNTYIKRISSADKNSVAEVVKPTGPVETKLTDEERLTISRLEMDYTSAVEYEITGYETYSDAPPIESLLAEYADVDFPYEPAHEMRGVGVHSLITSNISERWRASSATHGSAPRMNEDLTSEFAKQLYNDGYEVVETTRECVGYYDGRVLDFTDWDNLPAPDIRFSYEMVYVKLGDKWYIAQDRLVR